MKKNRLHLFIFLPLFIFLSMSAFKLRPGYGDFMSVGERSRSGGVREDVLSGRAILAGHSIGENYGGGIVFYVSNDGQHGLIAATEDQNPGIPWYNGLTRYAGTLSDGLGAGAANTKAIVSKLIHDDEKGLFAARVCADYSVGSGGSVYKGWYLPSKLELNLLYQQKKVVGGFANTNYWSSTEYKTNSVWIQEFGSGHQRVSNSESYANAVRAIRAF